MTTPSNDVAGIDELKRQLQLAAAENARLRDRQNASAEILRTIAASPSDARPVFAAIASSSKRLLGGFSATVLQFIGDELHLVAFTPTSPEADDGLKAAFPRRIEDFPTFALVRDGETIQFPDSEADDVPELNRNLARLRGFRSVLFMPLMNRGAAVGMISVTREQAGAFAPDLVQLLQTFADQAVIAIENARLFNETRETLERQTATADILKVMAASPSDVQPVFDAIAANANRLIGGFSTAVLRYIDGAAHLAAFTPGDPAGDRVLQASFPVPFAQFPAYPLVANGQSAQLPDTELEPAARDIARARGFRSMLFTPLMSEGEAVGVILATRRATGSFAGHHVRLMQTFADQAVIAVKNVSLFNATREADRDRRHPQGHRRLARRRHTGVPGDLRQRQGAGRRPFLHGHPRHQWHAAPCGLHHRQRSRQCGAALLVPGAAGGIGHSQPGGDERHVRIPQRHAERARPHRSHA
jgi:GAF domain-containing protein